MMVVSKPHSVDNRAFLVLGPESSGTRLMCRILMAAGCVGSDRHDQEFDVEIPPPTTSPIVWRRSVPHAFEPLRLSDLLLRLHRYDVQAVVTVRNTYCVAKSQVETGHVATVKEAYRNINVAYVSIFKQLSDLNLPFNVSEYSSLVLNQPAQVALLKQLRLPFDRELIEVRDENAKWLSDSALPDPLGGIAGPA